MKPRFCTAKCFHKHDEIKDSCMFESIGIKEDGKCDGYVPWSTEKEDESK